MKKFKYQALESYVRDIVANPQRAWDVPIGNKVLKDDYYATASYAHLSKALGISTDALRGNTSASAMYSALMEQLNDVLKKEGVLLKKESASALELRRNTLNWWRGLSIEEKKEVATFGNSVQAQKYIKGWRRGKGYELLGKVCSQINEELIELGVLTKDYIEVKDRDKLRDKSYIANQKASKKRWDDLGRMPLRNVDDFLNTSSETEPFSQLKHLAAVLRHTASSRSTKNNFRDGFNHLCRFLKANGIPENETLKNILNEFILKRFKADYILPALDSGEMSPNSAPTIVSAVRAMLKRAKSIEGLDFHSFYDVEMIAKGRTGEYYKPYTTKEREAISYAIQSDINEITKFTTYFKTGIGENPFDEEQNLKAGMGTLDNARFLFENHLACQPVFNHTAKSRPEKAFLSIVKKSELGLHGLYKSWGILPVIDAGVIAPFLLRLAQVTGMNADSLIDLTHDDFVPEHPVTGKPCLRYWKERSTGEKEMHLDLFEAKLQWLTRKQSKEIEEIFNSVKALTTSIRSDAPDSIKDLLFIYKSTGQNSYGVVKRFNLSILTSVYKNFVSRHNLVDTENRTLSFSISRFRPTFVSELIEAGVSIREIQLLLGHSNIQTTINYLDRLDFNRIARLKLSETLKHIHAKVIKPAKKQAEQNMEHREITMFSTPLAGCSNLFSPPDFIQKSSLYKKGQPCSQYNKCLSCDNVMIIAEHLPMLFAMKRDYMILMQRNRIMDTPYGVVIEENLSVLDEILNPEKSDFSEEELEKGERLSMFEQTAYVDGVTA
ncbi:MAG: site-specific integrase [Idiomarina sp.]|nr:site-specific integrase [Idiomarina sp.]